MRGFHSYIYAHPGVGGINTAKPHLPHLIDPALYISCAYATPAAGISVLHQVHLAL